MSNKKITLENLVNGLFVLLMLSLCLIADSSISYELKMRSNLINKRVKGEMKLIQITVKQNNSINNSNSTSNSNGINGLNSTTSNWQNSTSSPSNSTLIVANNTNSSATRQEPPSNSKVVLINNTNATNFGSYNTTNSTSAQNNPPQVEANSSNVSSLNQWSNNTNLEIQAQASNIIGNSPLANNTELSINNINSSNSNSNSSMLNETNLTNTSPIVNSTSEISNSTSSNEVGTNTTLLPIPSNQSEALNNYTNSTKAEISNSTQALPSSEQTFNSTEVEPSNSANITTTLGLPSGNYSSVEETQSNNTFNETESTPEIEFSPPVNITINAQPNNSSALMNNSTLASNSSIPNAANSSAQEQASIPIQAKGIIFQKSSSMDISNDSIESLTINYIQNFKQENRKLATNSIQLNSNNKRLLVKKNKHNKNLMKYQQNTPLNTNLIQQSQEETFRIATANKTELYSVKDKVDEVDRELSIQQKTNNEHQKTKENTNNEFADFLNTEEKRYIAGKTRKNSLSFKPQCEKFIKNSLDRKLNDETVFPQQIPFSNSNSDEIFNDYIANCISIYREIKFEMKKIRKILQKNSELLDAEIAEFNSVFPPTLGDSLNDAYFSYSYFKKAIMRMIFNKLGFGEFLEENNQKEENLYNEYDNSILKSRKLDIILKASFENLILDYELKHKTYGVNASKLRSKPSMLDMNFNELILTKEFRIWQNSFIAENLEYDLNPNNLKAHLSGILPAIVFDLKRKLSKLTVKSNSE